MGKVKGGEIFAYLFVCFVLICLIAFFWIDYFRIFFLSDDTRIRGDVGSEVESRKSMCDVKCPTSQRSYVKSIYVHNAIIFVKKYYYFAKNINTFRN